MASTNHCTPILLVISVFLMQFCYSTTTTLSTDCGNLIISCNEPDIKKCCQGPCCALLSQYQDREPAPIEDETEAGTVTVYTAPPLPVPQTIPNVGEACSSRYSRDERCLGANTKCRFDDYDSNGYLLGNCCVEHNMNGCTKDADCCKYDGVCFNGQCTRNLPPRTNIEGTNQINDDTVVQTENGAIDDAGSSPGQEPLEDNGAQDGSNGVQSARSHLNIDIEGNNNEENEIDLHEKDRSKPNYELWLSLTANMILFVLILFISLCALNWWLYRNYYRNKRRKNINMNRISMMGARRECGNILDSSDSTNFEEDSGDVRSAHGI